MGRDEWPRMRLVKWARALGQLLPGRCLRFLLLSADAPLGCLELMPAAYAVGVNSCAAARGGQVQPGAGGATGILSGSLVHEQTSQRTYSRAGWMPRVSAAARMQAEQRVEHSLLP